jgi:hypothetical protein
VTPRPWLGVAGGAAVGAAFLVWMAGGALLDPTRIEWLMKLDWVPHYFGWFYFRTEPWHWPPGTIRGYYAPLGSSIGLTDAIPLAAYLLKPLAAWLPEPFQYIGLWWLLCFTLQGALGARLIARVTASPALQVLGAALFVLLPTLLTRIGHAALCSHWLVLWALVIATRPPAERLRRREWAALGLCAGLIQPYLAAMVLPLLLAIAIDARAAVTGRVQALAVAVATTVTGWWLSGLFVLSGEGSLAAGGLGYFSMNLLAPITPEGWSRVLPELPVAGAGQTYEGFHYLGLGVIALLAVAAVLAGRARMTGAAAAPGGVGPAVRIVALLMTLFAISPTVTMGRAVLVDLNGPLFAPLAAFRSSGRFVWPLTYILLTWGVVTVARRLRPAIAVSVVAAAVGLQLFDLHDAHAARRRTARDPGFQQWTRRFLSPEWAEVTLHRHLVLVPPPQCGAAPVEYEAAVRFAADHGMTVNAGVIARGDDGARREYCAALDASVRGARLEPGAVYLVHPPTARALTNQLGDRVRCRERDALWSCVATGGERLETLGR